MTESTANAAGLAESAVGCEIDALLAETTQSDVRLWVEDGQLRFSAAQGSLTDSLRQRLAARKADLIIHLSAASSAEPPLAPLETDAPRPLSFAQQRLWFLEQMGGVGSAYTLSSALDLAGPLDVAALQAALTEVVGRHQVLRTVFRSVDDRPHPEVLPAAAFQLIVDDLTGIAVEDRMATAIAGVRDEAARPFDLSRDILLRGRLARLAADRHVLTLVAHHAAIDGWSLSILGRELGILYRSIRGGAAAPLPDLPIQYADYAAWERRRLSGPRLQKSIERWRRALDGAPTVLDLPTDRIRPTIVSYRGGRQRFSVPAGTVRRLEATARAQAVTPFLVLFTAFAVLLHRLGAPEDMVIGTPAANRTRPELETLIGLFVNTLPLRVDLSGDPTFAQLLERARDVGLEAFDQQDMPFDKLVECLDLERHLSHAPLVQAMFTYLNAPAARLDLDGIEARGLDLDPGTSQFDLSLTLEADGSGGLAGFIDYAADVFEDETAARWAGYYRRLLDGVADALLTPVSKLGLLSPDERRDLLETWSGRDAGVPDRLVHEAFAEMAQARPDAPALTMGEETLSYGQLDARAERLARRLAAHLDGPEPIVGICLERSIPQIVAVLAAFKAGAACLPLDPHYPAARLAYMLEDSRARIVVTSAALADGLALQGRIVLCDDGGDGPTGTPRPSGDPARAAYLIYTSGTTGNPKGVVVEHGPLAAHLPAISERYAMRTDDRFLQAASLNFDLSWEQIFVTFASGAELVLLPPGTTDPHEILSLARRHALTVLNLPPALWLPMVRAAKADPALVRDLPLRLMVVGSETMPVEGVPLWRDLGLGVPVMNSYGPTEAVITSAMFDLPDDGPVGVRVPIGHPVAGHRCYILDRHLEPVPIGVPGELHVGGIGLARGYLHQPELSAERFLPDPFAGAPGRMYRTGDLARWRPDGAIDFLGRVDRQIKLRGFRIEPGEIESALIAHDAVELATVVLRGEGGRTRLVAYCVCPDGMPPTRELRRHLGERLPEYMVPAAFVALERLPLMPNGKIDRKALPEPEAAAAAAGVAPRDALEEIIAGLWGSVLRQPAVGIHDNFFELGGHSMLATQVAARLRAALGIAVPVRWLFEAPTVAELAERLHAVLAGGGRAVSVPANRIPPGTTRITPDLLPLIALSQAEIDQVVRGVDGGAGNVQDLYPLAPLQEGILFHHQLQTTGDAYLSLALLAFDKAARCDAFIAALQSVIDRHDILRTAIVWDQLPEPLQVVWRRAVVPVETRHFDPADGPVAQQLVEAYNPRHTRLELTRAPLLRIILAEDGDRTLMLYLSHHLIMDHTTLEVLLEEIGAHLKGEAQRLPPPVPFRDFVAEARQGITPAQHEAFFRDMLDGIETPTAPFGLIDVQGDGAAAVEARLDLTADLARRLRRQASQMGATPAALCHLAWALVLSRCCAQDDVVFGTVLFGRLQGGEGVERAFGMFINTLPFRLTCDDRPVDEALRQTQQRMLALLRHEHASLTLAQRCSKVQPPTPLFSTLFNYRHSPESGAAATPLDGIEFLRGEERTNYPLAMAVDDLGEGFALTAQVAASVDPQRVCALTQHALAVLVTALEEAPRTPLRSLDILPAAERRQLLVDWNRPAAPLPNLRVHQLFEAQAEKTPTAPAVVFEDEILSYGELNARANRLAHALIAKGIEGDGLVAIALERSPEMIVALLAIFKAGGAYVPLDPDYPAERLAFMLADSGARVLITQESLLAHLPGGAEHTLCLDADRAGIAAQPAGNPRRSVAPHHLAYVIYTSGSTGKPKGVAIEHHAIAYHCHAIQAYFELTPGDRVLQFASLSFDASVEQILPTLCSGAAVVLPEHGMKSPEALDRILKRHQVSVAHLPPAFFEQWIRTPQFCLTDTPLRLLQVGGDVLPTRLVSIWHAASPTKAVRLLNGYGPTETTITASFYEIPETPIGPSVPIGRPLPGRAVYILDRHGRPAPIGVAGELHIGGSGLARGYLNRPELTTEKFIADPFSDAPGARLYKTGDLVRYRPDGNVEFLGRLDHQVKIRGFRIELGEIEAALATHPAVREAVVVARDEASGDKRLVAYVVADSAGLDVLTEPGQDAAGKRVVQWRAAFEGAYGSEAAAGDLAFDIRAWRDSRTGEPIPAEDMREWVDSTVRRILALGSRRVLEIGCGTGLLLARVAPRCERYVATDFSATAAAQAQRLVEATPGLEAVEVLCRPADDFSGLDAGTFDLVVINSVVQYFPDPDYLVRVLAGAASLVADGGALFVGDVRHADLLDHYQLFALLPSAPAQMPLAEFAAEWRRRIGGEEELLLNPAFFGALGTAIPRLAAVEAQIKEGRADNEMTLFRFDAVLRLGAADFAASPTIEWSGRELTADDLRARLEREQPSSVVVRGVANRRLTRLATAMTLVETLSEETVEALRRRFEAFPVAGPYPQDLADVGLTLDYQVAIGWSGDGPAGDLDIALRRDGPAIDLLRTVADRAGDPFRHVGNPLRREQLSRLPEALRLHADTLLPDYMLPAAVVVLDRLPLSPTGKVDRRRLPEPDFEADRSTRPVVRPRTPIEAILCDLFAEVLGVRRIGVDDDFFRLGGHSLMATQLVTRARAATGREVSLRWLFETPTPAALAERVESAGATDLPPIVRRAGSASAPLSFAQRRLWFLDRLEPGGHSYNMPGAFRLIGDLKVAALEAAFTEVVRRHAALRTRFVERDGEPVQEILPAAAIPMPVDDLAHLAPATREAEVRACMLADAATPFDLAVGPLIRIRLLRLNRREHVLLATMHHIVSDGWSIGVLAREIAALYAANLGLDAAEHADLAELPVSYADFAAWQNEVMAGERLSAEIGHWRARLKDAPAVLSLPADRPRRDGVAFAAGTVRVKVPVALTAELASLSRKAGATLFMTLLAGYAALLGRWAGQDDVVVGTPVANRTRLETEGLIGFFVNTLALRTGSMAGLDALGLIGRVRDVALDAFSHQDVPFERLVEDLRPQRNASHSPLFQTMFVFQNLPDAPVTLPGLTLEALASPSVTAKFELTLLLEGDGDAITGTLEFNADLFARDTVQSFVEQWLALLSGMAAAPDAPVDRIALIAGRERQRLLAAWSDGGRPLRADATILDLLAERAAADPQAVALDDGAARITFAELARRVDRGAGALHRRGVRPGHRVAVALARGIAQVTGFLAVLRAGAGAVPLDITHPQERRQAIAADAAAAVVVDRPLDDADGAPPAMPAPQDDAYTIYTSGSTGRPKGVVVGHAGLANLGLAQAKRYDLKPGSRLLQIVSPAFDVAVGQIATMLASGATLCFAAPEDSLPGPALADLLARRRITHLEITPSMLAALPDERPLPDLAVVVVGGEPCPAALAARWAPNRRLINAYGPTETTVCATTAEIDPGDGRFAIGTPLPGVRTYIVDGAGSPVPPGVAGELWIGGIGVARGYLGDDELTRTRFAADPFAGDGGRLYRTGDLARWRRDGQIEFLGRNDGQVKLRGVRVELAEVEAALKEQPGIADALADIRGGDGTPRLVAWVVPLAGATPAAAELRDALRTRLPDAFVPSAIGLLQAIPRTTSGKADRRSLAEPGPEQGPAAPLLPRDERETSIAGMWSELLDLTGGIDIHTSFFDLGGHSLLASRLVSKLRDGFAVDVPLRRLFAAPTIAGLASLVAELASASTAADGPIRPTARRQRARVE